MDIISLALHGSDFRDNGRSARNNKIHDQAERDGNSERGYCPTHLTFRGSECHLSGIVQVARDQSKDLSTYIEPMNHSSED
jgi:hypothetical protein